jgi:hypothetical protein
MEIHPPLHPIMSVREFLVHLSMVTLGILIALGLEQSVEAYHHRELAKEARENMRSEIRDNKKELDDHLGEIAKLKKERGEDLQVINKLLAHEKLTEMSLSLNFSGATLNSASWTTASTIGALVYMDYRDVKQFAEVYKRQEFYDQLQNEQIKMVQVGLGMMNSFDAGKVPDEELRAIRNQLLQSDAALVVLDQLGRQLDAQYDKLLTK